MWTEITVVPAGDNILTNETSRYFKKIRDQNFALLFTNIAPWNRFQEIKKDFFPIVFQRKRETSSIPDGK